MRYRVLFLLDKKTTMESARDIKLSLVSQSIDMSIVSDYPIFIPDKDNSIYIGNHQFNITSKDVKITKDFHTIEVSVLDMASIESIKKEENDLYISLLNTDINVMKAQNDHLKAMLRFNLNLK